MITKSYYDARRDAYCVELWRGKRYVSFLLDPDEPDLEGAARWAWRYAAKMLKAPLPT